MRATQTTLTEAVTVQRPARAGTLSLRRLAWGLLLPSVTQTTRASATLAFPKLEPLIAVLTMAPARSRVVAYGTKTVSI